MGNVFSYSGGFHEFMHGYRSYGKPFLRIDVNQTAFFRHLGTSKVVGKKSLVWLESIGTNEVLLGQYPAQF